jgi:hypothetical protein
MEIIKKTHFLERFSPSIQKKLSEKQNCSPDRIL